MLWVGHIGPGQFQIKECNRIEKKTKGVMKKEWGRACLVVGLGALK